MKENRHILTLDEALQDCRRIETLAEDYAPRLPEIWEELSAQTVRQEFSRGGEVIHRGYYCPSPVQDLVIGNNGRGKLLKGKPKTPPSFTYGFNADGELITVSSASRGKECIFRTGDYELGVSRLSFSEVDSFVHLIAETRYRENRVSDVTIYSLFFGHVTDFLKEVYTYTEEGLKVADYYFYTDFTNHSSELKSVILRDEYIFEHDENGFLSACTPVRYDRNDLTRPVRPMEQCYPFPITKKRKV